VSFVVKRFCGCFLSLLLPFLCVPLCPLWLKGFAFAVAFVLQLPNYQLTHLPNPSQSSALKVLVFLLAIPAM
jgi:hypothetical protein